MKSKLIPVLLLFLFSSCGLLITQKVLLGVRNPKNQTTQKIQKFITKNKGLDSTLTLTKESFISKISQSNSSFAQWEMYDKQGNRIIPLDSNIRNCNGYTHLFFKGLPNSQYSIDTNRNIFSDSIITTGLTQLNGTKAEIKQRENYDYYLVIYWATFMGKYSSDLFNLEKTARNNQLTSISTLKINMDFKDYYSLTEKDLNFEMKVRKSD